MLGIYLINESMGPIPKDDGDRDICMEWKACTWKHSVVIFIQKISNMFI